MEQRDICPSCSQQLIEIDATVGPDEAPYKCFGCPPCHFEDWMFGPITVAREAV